MRLIRSIVALLVLSALPLACGDDDDEEEDPNTRPENTGAACENRRSGRTGARPTGSYSSCSGTWR